MLSWRDPAGSAQLFNLACTVAVDSTRRALLDSTLDSARTGE
jgi:hypothetical protein